MTPRNEIHVIGGGLGGLTAAAFVARAGLPVVVHESRGRLGGRATTDNRDGFRCNQGPHAFYRGGPGLDVLAELGIEPVGVAPPTAAVAVRDGQVFAAPTGPVSLLRTKLFGAREKAAVGRLLAALPRLRASDFCDLTIGDWIEDRTSLPRVRQLLHTLVRLATYANAPGVLSADVAIEQLQRAAGDGVLYLDNGWQQLVEALASRSGVRFERNDPVGSPPDAAAVIVAVGGPAAAGALVGRDYASVTGPPAETSSLDLGIRGLPANDIALGITEPLYLSRHSIAAGLAPPGHSNLVVAEYLAADREPSRDRLSAFARTAGVADHAIVTERYLHRMTAVTAIPTAIAAGLRGRPGVAVPDADGVFVVGDWVGPDGHLVEAVLASARAAALAAVRHVERSPVPQ